VMYVGSQPSSDGRWESWLEFTMKAPYPIRYSLTPITELFSPVYFKYSDEATLKKKKARSVSVSRSLHGHAEMHVCYYS